MQTIPTVTINEINQLIYTTAPVISEMLGYKMNSPKEQCPPWRKRLEAKIKIARRDVSQLSELQKSAIKKHQAARYLKSWKLPDKDSQLSPAA